MKFFIFTLLNAPRVMRCTHTSIPVHKKVCVQISLPGCDCNAYVKNGGGAHVWTCVDSGQKALMPGVTHILEGVRGAQSHALLRWNTFTEQRRLAH